VDALRKTEKRRRLGAHLAELRGFLRGVPGRRFSDHYVRQRRARSVLARALAMTAAAVLLVLGSIMLVTPGPGVLTLVLGAALIASQSHGAARRLDRLELAFRARLRRWRSRRLARAFRSAHEQHRHR
jgi:hypothetical protein